MGRQTRKCSWDKSATHSICVKLLHIHKHDKLTQCCRVFTSALARLSCWRRVVVSVDFWPYFIVGFHMSTI